MKIKFSLLATTALLAAHASILAGTWLDHFSRPVLVAEWLGNRDSFSIQGEALRGVSASPLFSPLNIVEVGKDWSDYQIQCWVNVVAPNVRVCTKGGLILRHTGKEGYVFALHQATQTIEVYRLSDHEMLLSKAAVIDFKKWYHLRAILTGPTMSFFVDDQLIGSVTDDRSLTGAAGVAVQDAEEVLFDDFEATGPSVPDHDQEFPAPQISSVQREGNQVVFRFTVESSYHYSLQSSPSLKTRWEPLASFTAKLAALDAVAYDTPTSGARFYRLEKTSCECR